MELKMARRHPQNYQCKLEICLADKKAAIASGQHVNGLKSGAEDGRPDYTDSGFSDGELDGDEVQGNSAQSCGTFTTDNSSFPAVSASSALVTDLKSQDALPSALPGSSPKGPPPRTGYQRVGHVSSPAGLCRGPGSNADRVPSPSSRPEPASPGAEADSEDASAILRKWAHRAEVSSPGMPKDAK